MAFAARTRTAAGRIGHLVSGGIDRAVRETRRRQLEWQLDRQYAALGRVMYPPLQTGGIHTALPGALERMAAIEALTERLVAIRPGPMSDALDRPATNDDEERWADEGGQHIA